MGFALHQNETASEQSAQMLQTIIDVMQTGIHTLKPIVDGKGEILDFRIHLVNEALLTMINPQPEEVVGAVAGEYWPGYKENGLFDIYKDSYLTGNKRLFEFHYKEDDLDIFINTQVVKLNNELLVTATNVTELKCMQMELEASVAELKRSNASLEQFAHASSHDLQEPLRKIITYTDKLLEEYAPDLNDDVFGYLERIRTAGKRMRRLIQDLLIFAEVGSSQNEHTRIDLTNLVQDVLIDLEVAIVERDAKIHVGSLGYIMGDSLHIQQLFQNLIGNALKYSRHDVRPEIFITAKVTAGENTGLDLAGQEIFQQFHEIEIKDNGQGFSKEEAASIFKIFTRLPQHRTETTGTGIGLAIVQRVVENHRGYIIAEGRPGEGATFKIFFPF
jgi:signal transduction histidine kinase